MNEPNPSHHLAHLHATFLVLLPRIEVHGRIYFRHLRSHHKADALQEMRALAWKWLLQLDKHGKDPCAFPTTFVTFLARAVNSGRRLVGSEKAKDAMSRLCQKRHGFQIERLPQSLRSPHEHLYASPNGQNLHDELEERLRDNTVSPVPDQVQFRIDFPAWLKTLTPRERRMIRGMARNERTLDLSKQFEVSPGRISQMRRELHEGWMRFCGERDEMA